MCCRSFKLTGHEIVTSPYLLQHNWDIFYNFKTRNVSNNYYHVTISGDFPSKSGDRGFSLLYTKLGQLPPNEDVKALMLCLAEAPKADLDNILPGKDIRVKAGEPISLNVPISGSPIPTVCWKKNGKDMMPSNRVYK